MTKQFYLGCARFSSKTIILFHVILRINYRHRAALQTVLVWNTVKASHIIADMRA